MFCGYGKIYKKRSIEELKKILDAFFIECDTTAKIFGSGSFLDKKQIPEEVFNYFINKCIEKKINKITIESRPEYITKEKILKLKETNAEIEISIGLECADDKVLKKINKGFKLKDFEEASNLIHSLNCKLRAYLLVNLPYKNNLNKSVEYALNYADSIVLINLLPHENSQLFQLWLNGEWNFLTKKEFYKIVKKWEGNKKIEFDAETFKFIPKFPREMQKTLRGVGEEYLTHPFYEVWQDYLCRWYEKPAEKNIALFLPCSAKKPYSISETHKNITKVLYRSGKHAKIHQIVASNPGVIPKEFDNFYPFNAYDWEEKNETPEIKKRYIEITKQRIKNYLKAQKYEKIICFLKYTETYEALKQACAEENIELKNLLKKETYEKIKERKNCIITDEALKDLEKGLKEIAL